MRRLIGADNRKKENCLLLSGSNKLSLITKCAIRFSANGVVCVLRYVREISHIL